MPKIDYDNHHPNPCAACGHRNYHSDITGCVHMTGPASYCPCKGYKAPEPTVGSTIPSRRTDPATSHQAHQDVALKAGTQRARMLAGFAALQDATDEEAMEAAQGVSPMSEFAKRSSELRDGGYIVPTGSTRKGGSGSMRIVSQITDKGRAALDALSARK